MADQLYSLQARHRYTVCHFSRHSFTTITSHLPRCAHSQRAARDVLFLVSCLLAFQRYRKTKSNWSFNAFCRSVTSHRGAMTVGLFARRQHPALGSGNILCRIAVHKNQYQCGNRYTLVVDGCNVSIPTTTSWLQIAMHVYVNLVKTSHAVMAVMLMLDDFWAC